MNMLQKLWNDEAGFVISSELVLVATVMVIGLLVGMATLREQVVQELGDVADAISEITQSYSYSSITGHNSSTAGSTFTDTADACDTEGTGPNTNAGSGNSPQCIAINATAGNE